MKVSHNVVMIIPHHKHDSQNRKPHPKKVGGKYLGDRALNYIIMR